MVGTRWRRRGHRQHPGIKSGYSIRDGRAIQTAGNGHRVEVEMMRIRGWVVIVGVVAGVVVLTGCAHEWNGRVKEEEQGLLEQAGITEEAAIAKAKATVPEGQIRKAEIEWENEVLIFTFDIKVEGERGVWEVHLDAMTGALLTIENEGEVESAEAEQAETEQEEAEEEEAEEAEAEESEAQEAAEAGETAEWDGKVQEEAPGLLARAKITTQQAARNALAKVPGGVVTGGEIEMAEERLIYSLDIRVAGQEGITEVWVDALTGEVVKIEHEK